MKSKVVIVLIVLLSGLNLAVPLGSARASGDPGAELVVDKVYTGPGRLFLLAIGINTYSNFPKLEYSVPDATAVTESLERRGSAFTEIHKKQLLDAEATKQNIEAALDAIARDGRPNDTFVFSFSAQGHVFTVDDSGGVTAADFYLLPVDCDNRAISRTAISGRALRSYFRRIRAVNQLVILDSCGSSFGFTSAASSVVEQDQDIATLLRINSLFIGTDTLEFEIPELGHGLITSAVLNALRGEGDYNKDGTITARELEAYVYSQLRAYSAKYIHDKDVHPQTITRGDDFFIGYTDNKVSELAKLKQEKKEARSSPNISADDKVKDKTDASIKANSAERTNTVTNANPVSNGAASPALTRSEPLEPRPADKTEARKGTDYALLIATNDYQDKDSWRTLSNPIADAEAIESRLIDKYGFKKENVRLERNPTRRKILDLIREYKTRTFDNPKEDQLFIFFAGHGLVDKETGDGYLVASDSSGSLTDECEGKLIQVETLVKLIDQIQCAHIFVAFDACFIGQVWKIRFQPVKLVANFIPDVNESFVQASLFQPASFNKPDASIGSFLAQQPQSAGIYTRATKDQYIKDRMNNRTRIIFTSGDRPVYDGDPGKHSPFAQAFIETLDRGGMKHGVLPTSEIYASINDIEPKPDHGMLDGSDGDFLFIARPRGEVSHNQKPSRASNHTMSIR